uniref:GSVIVT00036363001 n=1 Tax=Arundo donax TaxID=35708 RepID=A0A0A8YMG8_ARUDO
MATRVHSAPSELN